MKVAAIQMVSGISLDANLSAARALLDQAARAGAELAVLPEYFCLIGLHDADKLAIAEPLADALQPTSVGTPMQHILAKTAKEHGIWLIAGTLPIQAPGSDKVYNTTLVYDPQGHRVARYDKIHLFRYDNGREAYDEAAVLRAGDTPVSFEMPTRHGEHWRIGMSVCYDLRFGELYRMLAADLLLVPAAFTHTTGQAHWEVLLRARAIENQAYVIASAQGGVHENGRRTWGHSMVIDPWGQVMAMQAEGPGVVLADIDLERLRSVREQLPSLQHRRL